MSSEYYLEKIAALEKRLSQLETIDATPIVVRATQSNAQSLTHNTFTAIDFNATPVNTRNAVTTIPNWRFNAPVGGYYQVDAAILIGVFSAAWAVAEPLHLWIYLNGAQYAVLDAFYNATASGGTLLSGGTIVPMNKSQYLEIFGYQFSGGALTLNGDPLYNWVSIHRIQGSG